MLLVIFGAGASYDSSPDYPPIAAGLFDERFGPVARDYPPCQPLLPRLRAVATARDGSIEATLERLRDEGAQYPHRPRQLMALRHYLRDALRACSTPWYEATNGQTNYAMLLDRIEAWRHRHDERVLLVTFNYDTVLEYACRAVIPGFAIGTIEGYVAHPHYKLIKLHGSVDWSRVVPTDRTLEVPDVIERAAELQPSDTYIVGELRDAAVSLVPAISIPTMTKTDSDFECPPPHRELLWGSLPEVTRVLVVGWRGMEAHFMEHWRQAVRCGRQPPANRARPGAARGGAEPPGPRRLLGWRVGDAGLRAGARPGRERPPQATHLPARALPAPCRRRRPHAARARRAARQPLPRRPRPRARWRDRPRVRARRRAADGQPLDAPRDPHARQWRLADHSLDDRGRRAQPRLRGGPAVGRRGRRARPEPRARRARPSTTTRWSATTRSARSASTTSAASRAARRSRSPAGWPGSGCTATARARSRPSPGGCSTTGLSSASPGVRRHLALLRSHDARRRRGVESAGRDHARGRARSRATRAPSRTR